MNLAIGILVDFLCPGESKKNKGESCPCGRDPPPPLLRYHTSWLLAQVLALLLALGLPMPPLLLPPPLLLLPLRCCCSERIGRH